MNIHESVFIELLRTGMWGTTPNVPKDFNDWDSVVKLAKSQAVLGIVGNVLLSDVTLSKKVPQDLQMKVKQFVMSSVMVHNLLNRTLVQVVERLRSAGIETVLLKGQGLARNYPKPELRQCGDIDLYVGVEHASQVYDLLAPLSLKIEGKEHLEVGKHFNLTMPGGVEIEVHRFTQRYYTKTFDRVYQVASDRGTTKNIVSIDFSGTKVNTPADDFNAFFVFSHMFHHYLTSGVGLRQISDWMMFLHQRKDELDLERLHQLLVDMDMMKPWKAFGCLLVDVLGMPEEEFPFFDRSQEDKCDKILRCVLDEGNFGKERSVFKNRGSNYLLNKARSLCGHISKSFNLMFLFPTQVWNQYLSTIIGGFTIVWEELKLKVSSKK